VDIFDLLVGSDMRDSDTAKYVYVRNSKRLKTKRTTTTTKSRIVTRQEIMIQELRTSDN